MFGVALCGMYFCRRLQYTLHFNHMLHVMQTLVTCEIIQHDCLMSQQLLINSSLNWSSYVSV